MNSLKRKLIGLGSALPTGIKNSFFHFAYHLAPQEFTKFSHLYGHAPNMEMGLMLMRSLGFVPRAIIDVGAFQGDWSRMAKRVFPDAKLIMYEPREEPLCAATARELSATLHKELLGAETGKSVPFHVMESGSSVLNERSPLERSTEIRQLETLDNTLQPLAGPALLKIDAQGYELEILKGGQKSLPLISAILLEVAVIEINEGAPLLHEVVAFMDKIDFVTYDILEIHRRPLDHALNQVDLIFVREDSPLIADKRHFAS